LARNSVDRFLGEKLLLALFLKLQELCSPECLEGAICLQVWQEFLFEVLKQFTSLFHLRSDVVGRRLVAVGEDVAKQLGILLPGDQVGNGVTNLKDERRLVTLAAYLEVHFLRIYVNILNPVKEGFRGKR